MLTWRKIRRRVGNRIRALTGADETVAARHELAAVRDQVAEAVAARHDLAAIRDQVAEAVAARHDLAAIRDQITGATARFEDVLAIELERRRLALDCLADLQTQLEAARLSSEYSAAFNEPDPLITVRIASYQRTRHLLDIALPSVLAQTYPNFEIVIVNDGPNERTRAALSNLREPRIRYHELPRRGSYPEHSVSRWRVAGTPAGNQGLELARGRWIAPVDEDDTLTPDRLERLLALARAHRAELAYGAVLQRNLVTGEEAVIWSDPPTLGSFSLQGALYHAALSFFTYEPLAWTLHEPGDWNLTRRMLQAGVRIASTQEIVGTLHWVPVPDKPTHPWAAHS